MWTSSARSNREMEHKNKSPIKQREKNALNENHYTMSLKAPSYLCSVVYPNDSFEQSP